MFDSFTFTTNPTFMPLNRFQPYTIWTNTNLTCFSKIVLISFKNIQIGPGKKFHKAKTSFYQCHSKGYPPIFYFAF